MKHCLNMIVGMMAMVLSLPLASFAQNHAPRVYTTEDPLVYTGAVDRWPYVFLDNVGEPAGYNVDLLKLMFDELGIPFVIRIKDQTQARKDLQEHRADLMLDMSVLFDSIIPSSQTIVQLFTNSVASIKRHPVTVRTAEDLSKEKVYVYKASYVRNFMRRKGWEDNAFPFSDVDAAVIKVSNEGKGVIVWNTLPLEWAIRRNHIENLQLTPISIPVGEYHFVSYDTLLLARLDSIYTILDASGRLAPLQAKWFYPDHKEGTGIPSWIWFFVVVIAIVVVWLIIYNIIYYNREFRVRQQGQERNDRLEMVLHVSRMRVWTYDIATQNFTRLSRGATVLDAKNQKTFLRFSSLEFTRRFHSADFDYLYECLRQLADGEYEKKTVPLRVRDDKLSDETRDYVISLSVLRRVNGRPTVIMGVLSDVSDELSIQRRAHERLQRYQTVFNTAMIDMAYYDEKGDVVSMNQRVQETFGITQEDAIRQHIGLKIPIGGKEHSLFNGDFNPDTFERFHAIQKLFRADGSVMLYELQLLPVRDSANHLLGIYGTGRDVTESAMAYRQMQQSIKKVEQATSEITNYVTNINYVLGVGGVRMVTYSPHTHMLTVFKGLNDVQLQLTQTRCMTLVDDRSKRVAMRALDSMDNLTRKPLEANIWSSLRLRPSMESCPITLCLQMRFIPSYNEKGEVQNYFGLCRDVSDIRATEAMLEKESARAQEVETLKNSFLRNMSYEIRTPLNTVVGFAELFDLEHSAEDEAVFINEIKTNSAYLLELINDILFLSRLDARMIEIKPQPTDFAQSFEVNCHLGWGNKQKAAVRYEVDNPYSQFIVNIDDTNLGRIIQQVVANAATYTEMGYVRVRYEYVDDYLLIIVDDTGSGISNEVLDHIFDRFVSGSSKGTGLGLAICKELAEQMGGRIDIRSQVGKGTTVWITIPCEVISFEKKQ